MTTAMPALNGTRTSPSSPSRPSSTAKRKRVDSEEPQLLVNGSHSEGVANSGQSYTTTQNIIRDIWLIAESHDITPSILQHTISNASIRNTNEGDEPSSKRAKLVSSPATVSISTKVKNEAYNTIEELLSDVEAASSSIVSESKPKVNGATQWSYIPDALDQDRLVADTTAFKRLLSSLVRRGTVKREKVVAAALTEDGNSQQEVGVGQVKANGESSAPDVEQLPSRTVLTLFGNAQGHKQLFSSFQRPMSKKPIDEQAEGTDILASLTEPVMPLRENGLPNGISSTRIMPVPYDEPIKSPKAATFLELFPPALSLPPLNPPRTPKPPATQQPQSSVTWAESTAPIPITRQLGYAYQKLITGQWLGYDGVAATQDPSTQELQRKRRSRALSTGEATAVPSDTAVAVQSQAKEDALFRSAYSSFAPCRDNTAAVFSDELKNQLWWQKLGRQCFERAFAIDPALEPSDGANIVDPTIDPDAEEAAFKQAVELFEPEAEATQDAARVKEGEELLEEVSELLETLHSYHRIRNSSLNTNARSSVGQNPSLQDLMGSPSTPSTAEIETYNVLKAQLALIVAMLPPHAVAKLNGEQLEDLNISQSMPLEESSYRGVMEEDQTTRLAKAAALNAALGGAQARQGAMMTPSALQYPQARTAQMGSSRNQAQYYKGAPPPSLPRQSSSFSRQPLSAWQASTPTYNGASLQQRPSYTNQQSYGQQQTPRPIQSLRASLPQHPSIRPGATPMTTNGSFQMTPSQPYQQRAQNNTNNYNYNTNTNTASPYNTQQAQMQAMTSASPQPVGQQQVQPQYPRPSYQLSQPPQSLSPAPATQAGVRSGSSHPQTPGVSMSGQMQAQQAQSPGVAPSALMGRSVSGTPQA